MDMMNDRERTGATGPPPAYLLRPAPLGREDFAAAVRAALRDLHRDDRLRREPAVRYRGWPRGPADPPAALLRGDPRARGRRPRAASRAGRSSRRVLDRTFVRPAPTQEAAAEVLGLPFSTYRRHLAAAIDELVELLWAVEIGEIRAAASPARRPSEQRLSTELTWRPGSRRRHPLGALDPEEGERWRRIVVLGAGMNGLTTAMLLARDGHEVTVLERDPAAPPPAPDAWDAVGTAGRGPVPAAALHAAALAARRWRRRCRTSLDELVAAGGRRST